MYNDMQSKMSSNRQKYPPLPPVLCPGFAQKFNNKILDNVLIEEAREDFIETDASHAEKVDILLALKYIHENLLSYLPCPYKDVIAKNATLRPIAFHDRFAGEVTPDGNARRTPGEYITWARIQVARRILEHGACNMTELAYALGFNSYPTFWRACCKHLGCKPSEAAKMNGRVG